MKRGAVLADVTSANIVGYNTATVTKPNKKTFALQFESISDPGKPVAIDQLFPGTTFKAASSWATCDQIWVWDTAANNWAKYAYYEWKREPVQPAGWYKYKFLTDNSYVKVTAEDVVQPGQTFLFIRNIAGSVTLTMSGQVKALNDNTQSYTVTKPNKVFMTYPWPVEFKISELSTKATHTNLKAASSWATCDQIWAWNAAANNWAKYAYYEWKREPVQPAGWYKYNFLTDQSYVRVTDDDKVYPGEGFLYIRNIAGSNTITWKPLEDK